MGDTFNLIDGDYNIVQLDSRLSSNQIRTRGSSFGSIRREWIKQIKRDLDVQKDALVKDAYEANANGQLSETAQEEIAEKSMIISILEEKIAFLSFENIPKNYVENRAIKLRNSMMENLRINTEGVFKVPSASESAVFGEEVREDIKKSVEATNSNMPVEGIEAPEKNIQDINVEDISLKNEGVIAAELSDTLNNLSPSTDGDSNDDVQLVSPEDVAETVNGAFEDINLVDEHKVDDNLIQDKEEIIPVAEAKQEVEEEHALDDNIRVASSNNEVNNDRFNSDGEEKRYNYKPLTDDAISSTGFSFSTDFPKLTPDTVFKNPSVVDAQERDVPVIAPERAADTKYISDYSNPLGDDYYREITELPIETQGYKKYLTSESAVDEVRYNAKSKGELEEIKAMLLEKMRALSKSSQAADDAEGKERRVTEVGNKIDSTLEEVETELNQMVRNFVLYGQQLDSDIEEERARERAALEAANRVEQTNAEKQMKIDQMGDMIKDLTSFGEKIEEISVNRR